MVRHDRYGVVAQEAKSSFGLVYVYIVLCSEVMGGVARRRGRFESWRPAPVPSRCCCSEGVYVVDSFGRGRAEAYE